MNILQRLRRSKGTITGPLFILMALWQVGQPLQGADFYWDANAVAVGNAVDGSSLGGTGTWDGAALNWWDATSMVAWPNLNTANAIFTGPVVLGKPTESDVTLSGALTANKLSFLRSGYTLTGGTSLTLAGAAAGLHANVGETATISSLISGSDGLTKTGGGVILLSNSGNNYSGTTTIANGALQITDPAQLGVDTSAINVTESNATPLNTGTIGFPGGSLILDGTGGGITLTRDLNLQGLGAVPGRSGAVVSYGPNTLSGQVNMAAGTPTARSTRILAVGNSVLTLSGGLNVGGTPGTTISTLGGVNAVGPGNTYLLTGPLTGTGTLEKSGAGMLDLTPSSTTGFSGRVRVSGSAASGQSSVRVGSADVFGTANGGTTNAVLDLNGGVLEMRSDTSLNFNKNVYLRTSSTMYAGPSIGGIGLNETMSFNNFSFQVNTTATFNSRNGYGMSFTTAPVNGTNQQSTFTNNMGGLLSFTGNFWSNNDNAANRTLSIGGNGNTLINGNLIGSSAAFDRILTKTGVGSLTITGTGSTLDGTVNSNGGAIVITDFRSLNMHTAGTNTGLINLGTGGTAGGLVIGTSTAATADGLTTNKVVNLAGTTGAASIYANQAGINPVILNSNFTATGGSSTQAKTLTLGGTSASSVDNIINGVIPNNAAGGAVNLTKMGSNTWVLAGSNTFTGNITIANGTLKLKANAAASTIVPDSVDIIFDPVNVYARGTLEFVGQDGVNNIETLDVLTPTQGSNTIKLSPGVGGTASLVFTSLGTVGDGSGVNIVGSDASSTVTLANVATGLVSPRIYFDGSDFAYSNGGVLRAPVYDGDLGFVNAPAGAALPAGQDSFSINGDITAQGTQVVDTLKITGGHDLTLAGGATVTVRTGANNTDGGILVTGGSSTITGGTSIQTGGSGTLTFQVKEDTDKLTLETPIAGGSGGYTKNGAGTLVLAATNGVSGTISLNEGKIELEGVGTLGAANAALTLRQNTELDLNGVTPSTATGAFNSNGTVTNTSATEVTFTIGGGNGTGTSFGSINQTEGVINLTKVGNGAQSWLGTSNYTGVTTIGGTGLVTLETLADGGSPSSIGASTSAASNWVFNTSGAGGISYRGNNVLSLSNLTLGSRSASTDRLFTLAGPAITLASSQTTNVNNAVLFTNTGAIVHDGTLSDRTFTFGGSSQGDNTFNPQITNPDASFASSVVKTGTGIWKLGNSNNTYTGTTTLTSGILMAIDGEGLPSASNLAFDGGTLYSSGTLNRDIGTGAGQMQFTAPANANQAEFIGGFLGGDSKLTVNWSGTPVWDTTVGFLSERDGLMLNGSQARAQGATGSIALSEVDLTGNFSLGTAAGTAKAETLVTTNNSATVNFSTGNTTGLVVGQSITGPGIPSGAYITSINSATQVTISANAGGGFGTGAGTIIANTLRPIRVDDNTNTGADFATISGNLSAGDAVTGIRKVGGGYLRLTGDNTYEGETNVNQGVLAVMSLGSSGDAASTATSVGVSGVGVTFDAGNAVTLGNGGTGGAILSYLGTGETSDRWIQLNSTTGSNQIHADGTGPLILSEVRNDLVAGAKTLFLRGSNVQGNQITNVLVDNGGTLGVTVDGSATWILTNANTYTGLTTSGAGALGIGNNNALGTGTLVLSNGNIFAYGADRTVANTVNHNNNTTQGFFGDYSLTFTSPLNANISNANQSITTNNNIVAGKSLTFTGAAADVLPNSTRPWLIDGAGTTIIDGNITTTTAFGLNIVKNGNGVLQLNGTGGNFNQDNRPIEVDRGTLRAGASEVIPHVAGYGGLLFTPEVAAADIATFDLNGNTETVNALTAITDGTVVIDNTSASAAEFRFGANDSTVNFGSGIGTYAIQNTGTGALSLVKLGNTSTTFSSGVTIGNAGTIASEGGGIFNIAGPVTAATGLRAIQASTLSLSGGITNPGLITSIEVGGGSTLGLLDGAGSNIANLTTLNLGNTGTGTVTLNLNVGDLNTNTDRLNTDTLTLLTGGTLNLGQTITFNMTDAGLNANQTYTLLNDIDGNLLSSLTIADFIQGSTPGGFDSFNWFVDGNVVQLTTGNLLLNDLYWRGSTDNTWNANVNNWSTDKAGTISAVSIPGQGNKVIFAWDNPGAGALDTTLEQNFKINSLVFEAGATTTPSSVTIAPGTLATARLEIAPNAATEGITLSAGGPSDVTISANFRLGANQTWNTVNASSLLTLSGALLGEANVTKSGDGRVVLSGLADPTFNAGQTATFTVEEGNLEFTNTGALGTTANSNVASIVVNGGGFYYNSATAGTALTLPHAITLNGGALSGGGATHVYGGTVNVAGASTINLADSNGPITNTARSITLAGVVSGAGNLTINGNNAVSAGNQIAGNLTMNNAANSWSGDLLFNRGTVTIGALASPGFTGNDVTFDAFGKLVLQGVNSQILTRTGTISFASGAVGELTVDNTSGTLGANFLVEQDGAVSIGSGGTGATVRLFLQDAASAIDIGGAVTLGGNSSISVVGGDADSFATISGVIGDGASGYGLTVNDDAGGWGQTNTIIRLTNLNTFTGNVTIDSGVLEFNTVTNVSGGASALGNGTAISGGVGAGNLRFIGTTSQSTNRPITTGAGALTLSANGTGGASITYGGAITVTGVGNGSLLLLSGAAGSQGFITGGITQTGNLTDMTVNGGTWTHQTGTSRVADDMTVTGANTILNLDSGLFQVRDDITVTANAVMNLNATGVLSYSTATLSNDATLNINNGGVVNLGADNAIVATDFDRLFIGQGQSGALPGTLDMNTFNLTTSRLILGERLAERIGQIDGTGLLTVTGGDIDLYDGVINANLATTGTANFEKFGPGTVTLAGDNSGLAATGNAGQGVSIVHEGSLVLDYTTSNTTKLQVNKALDMRGGNLVLNGNNGAATAQTVVSFTLGSGGNSVLTLNPGTGQDIVLNLNAITRAVNSQDGSIRFNLPSGTQSATNGITTDSLNTIGTGPNAILGGWATVNDGTGVYFAQNVANAANGNIGKANTTTQDAVGSWLTGENVTDSTGFTGTLGKAFTLNSLRFDAATGSDLALGTDGHLRLTSGGILVTSNVGGTPSITGGTLDSMAFTLPLAINDLIITQDSASTFSIGSSIQLNTNLVKSGPGTLLLSGTNGHTGYTEIQNGVVQLSGGNAIGDTSIVTLAANRNTTLELLGNETIGGLAGGRRNDNSDYGTVNLGSHTLTINQTANRTFTGLFAGDGTVIKTGASTLTYNGISAAFTGLLQIDQGQILMTGNNANMTGVSSVVLNGSGSLRVDQTNMVNGNRINNAATITLNSTSGGEGLRFRNTDDGNVSETVGALTLGSGHNVITAESTDAGVFVGSWIFDSLAGVNNHATALVRGTTLGSGTDDGRIRFTNAPTGGVGTTAGGAIGTTKDLIILPYLVGDVTATGLGNTFVTNRDATNGLRPLAAAEYDQNVAVLTAGNNTRYTTSTPITTLAAINSLVLDSGTAIALTAAPTGGLTINSGAIIAAGAASHSIDSSVTTLETAGGRDYTLFVTNPAGQLTIGSQLTTAAPLVKSGAGSLVLTGVNTAVTDVYLNQGVVEVADLDNIGGDTGDLVFAGGTLRLGAAFPDDLGTRSISFLVGGATIDTNDNNLVFASSIGGGGAGSLTKTGAGDVTLNAAASYLGATSFSNGTLTLGVDNALPSGTNLSLGVGAGAATLDLNGFNQTVGSFTVPTNSTTLTSGLVIDPGKTFTANGNVLIGADAAASTTLFSATGGGSFVVNSPAGIFQVGGGTGVTNTNAVTADFSALANFTVDLGNTGIFRVGDTNNNSAGSPNTNSTLTLAGTANTITAGTVGIGDAQGQGGTATLELGGGTNVINADTLYIGATLPSSPRSAGALVFDGAGGSLTLRGSAGGSSRADVAMTTTTRDTGLAQVNSFFTAGHTADLRIDSFVMSERTTGTGAVTSTFSFDTGTLDITNLVMSRRSGAGTGDSTSTVALGGGSVIIGSIDMAASTGTGASSDSTATLNISGGTVAIGDGLNTGTAINMANAGTGRVATSNINLTGGTVSVTGDIVRTGGAGTENATLTLDGASLEMNGNSIGSASAPITFAAQSGANTLTGLGELNGGGVLTKSTAGVLAMGNGNTYTGGTIVSGGTLVVKNTTGSATGSGAVTVQASTILGGEGFIAPAADNDVTVNGQLLVGNPQATVGTSLSIITSGTGTTTLGALSTTTFNLWLGDGAGDNTGTLTAADRLVLGGTAALGGTLQVLNPNSLTGWALGDQWRLFDWSGLTGGDATPSGTFDSFDLPDLSSFNLDWDTSSLYTLGTIAIVVPEPSRGLLLLVGLLGLALRRRRRA